MAINKLKSKAVLASLCFVMSSLLASMEDVPNEVVRMFLEHMDSKQRKGVARVRKTWAYLNQTFSNVPQEKLEINQIITIGPKKPLSNAKEILSSNTDKKFQVNLEIPLSDYDILTFDNVRAISIFQESFNKEDLESLQLALSTKTDWWGFAMLGVMSSMTPNNISFLSSLSTNPYLAQLKIAFFDFNPVELNQLFEVLKDKELHFSLDMCELGRGKPARIGFFSRLFYSNEKMEILHKWLANNLKFISLALRADDINDNDVASLVPTLQKNTSLIALDLSENANLTFLGMANVVNSIRNSDSRITQLAFRKTRLLQDNIKPFADALRHDTKIKSLDLSDSIFFPEQIESLMEALEDNKTLLEFKLDDTQAISTKQKEKIAEILRRNRIIERETEID